MTVMFAVFQNHDDDEDNVCLLRKYITRIINYGISLVSFYILSIHFYLFLKSE